mgnify:CR=1 FL=1
MYKRQGQLYAIKELIKGTKTLNDVMINMLNKMAEVALNQAIFGNIGNNILDEGEDVGYDGCTDLYEDGKGTCLSANEGTFTDLCNSVNDQNILSD